MTDQVTKCGLIGIQIIQSILSTAENNSNSIKNQHTCENSIQIIKYSEARKVKIHNSVPLQMTIELSKEVKTRVNQRTKGTNQKQYLKLSYSPCYVAHVAPITYRHSRKLQQSFHQATV